ncbi:MAG: undecaprenyl-diphosphatase UppP [Acidobacteriota bacterium]
MSIWYAILLGLIQGLTEFLPISSTAHLTIAGKLLGQISQERPDEWTAFIAVIQLGTLFSVLFYFWQDILQITIGFLKTNLSLFTKKPVSESEKYNSKLGWFVIVGTIPAAIVGLIFRHQIEGVFTKDLRVISWALILLAIVLTVAELTARKQRNMQQLNLSDSLIIGISQTFSLIPGCSRSGSTITGGLFAGLTREAAARFSFLLSIPTIAASGLLELPKALQSTSGNTTPLIVATGFAFISGYASIAFLLRFLQKNSTFVFVFYRIILGIILLVLIYRGGLSI